MKNYTYNGPLTAVTLSDGTEVILTDGGTAALPEDNSFVQRLIALKRLTPMSDEQKSLRVEKPSTLNPQPSSDVKEVKTNAS